MGKGGVIGVIGEDVRIVSNCRGSIDLDRISRPSGRGGGGQRQGQEAEEGLDKFSVRILIQIFLDRESNVSNIWA